MREQCPACNKWSNDLPHHLEATCKERVKVRTEMARSNIERKTPIRKKGKSPLAKAKAKLDRYVSRYIRERDDYTCVICGTRNPVWTSGDWTSAECGHMITRVTSNLRFDIRDDGNCHCQCHRCNVNHGGVNLRFKHYTDQGAYILWYVHKFGLERYEQLREEGNIAKQWKVWEIEEQIEKLKGMGVKI